MVDSDSPQPAGTVRCAPVPGAIRMVAIDIDGTLLRSDKNLTRHTAQVIGAVAARGVRVVLATARPPRSVRRIHQALGLDTLVINYNGALIHDPASGRHLAHQPLALEVTRGVISAARKLDARVVVSLEILDRWYTDHVDPSLPTQTSLAFNPDYVGPLDAILQTPVTKLMLLAPPERLAPIDAAVRARFAGKVALAVSDEHLLQIAHPHATKGRAVSRVAAHYGIAREAVMAIGDAPNDLGMLRWAGWGVAVGNAWPQLRAAADAVVHSNDEDGVAEALRRFVME